MGKVKGKRRQNPIAVAMRKRHVGATKMKDRRAPRGGARDKQKEYKEDGY